jgi:hypothetical protein
VKLLLFSDLHLDAQFDQLGPQPARTRRRALRDTLTRITELARNEQVDALLCGGDRYEHERFSPGTAQFLRETFADRGSSDSGPTRTGNHPVGSSTSGTRQHRISGATHFGQIREQVAAAALHLAGNPEPTAAWDDLYRANVVITRRVLAAAAGHEVGRIVLGSSVHASGGHNRPDRYPIDPA